VRGRRRARVCALPTRSRSAASALAGGPVRSGNGPGTPAAAGRRSTTGFPRGRGRRGRPLRAGRTGRGGGSRSAPRPPAAVRGGSRSRLLLPGPRSDHLLGVGELADRAPGGPHVTGELGVQPVGGLHERGRSRDEVVTVHLVVAGLVPAIPEDDGGAQRAADFARSVTPAHRDSSFLAWRPLGWLRTDAISRRDPSASTSVRRRIRAVSTRRCWRLCRSLRVSTSAQTARVMRAPARAPAAATSARLTTAVPTPVTSCPPSRCGWAGRSWRGGC